MDKDAKFELSAKTNKKRKTVEQDRKKKKKSHIIQTQERKEKIK